MSASDGSAPAASGYGPVFQEHGRFLWGLCYRLTGCAADADDLVQETFVRAMERPPARTDVPWRPWLVRVAVNLGRDLLRRRRVRRAYVGPWLPSPIDTGDEESPPAVEAALGSAGSTEGRYDMVESVTFAFLLALEALTPGQRAVLLLRDVFDYTVRETADALDMSEASVKTGHHRARRAMQVYDRERCRPTRALQARTQQAFERLLASLATGDVAAVEALLTADVHAVSDGAGEFHAARRVIVGPNRVARFYAKISSRRAPSRVTIRMMNGLPALVVELDGGLPGEPRRFVQSIEVADDGRIRALHAVLASRKLTALPA